MLRRNRWLCEGVRLIMILACSQTELVNWVCEVASIANQACTRIVCMYRFMEIPEMYVARCHPNRLCTEPLLRRRMLGIFKWKYVRKNSWLCVIWFLTGIFQGIRCTLLSRHPFCICVCDTAKLTGQPL